MKKNNYKLLTLLIAVSMGFYSCVSDLDVTPIDPSVNQTFDQNAVFAKIYSGFQLTGLKGPEGNPDVTAANEGQMGLYRGFWNLNEFPTDEVCWAYESNYKIYELQTNKPTSSNPWIQNVYEYSFIEIVMCNSFLDLTANKTDGETIKQRAEIRFIRALHYSNLLDLYGNVPFVTTVSTELPKQIARKDLFAWIEGELKAIEPDMYQTKSSHDYYRVDVVADWLLLSRLYLNAEVYTGTAQWTNAAIYAKKVIDSEYTLATKYKYLFMGDNAGTIDGSNVNDAPNEIIFPVAANGKKTCSSAGSCYLVASPSFTNMTDSVVSNFLVKSKWGCNRVKPSLTKKFFPSGVLPTGSEAAIDLRVAANDDRAMLFAKGRTIAMTDRTDPGQGLTTFKFTNQRADGVNSKISDETFPEMDIPLMRKAEAYLTYAEAILRGGATQDGFSALQAVQAVRARANASTISSVTLDDVLDEWSREFYFEGRRRTDLIRFGYFGGNNNYFWDWKGGILTGTQFDKHYNLYPLPDTDLSAAMPGRLPSFKRSIPFFTSILFCPVTGTMSAKVPNATKSRTSRISAPDLLSGSSRLWT